MIEICREDALSSETFSERGRPAEFITSASIKLRITNPRMSASLRSSSRLVFVMRYLWLTSHVQCCTAIVQYGTCCVRRSSLETIQEFGITTCNRSIRCSTEHCEFMKPDETCLSSEVNIPHNGSFLPRILNMTHSFVWVLHEQRTETEKIMIIVSEGESLFSSMRYLGVPCRYLIALKSTSSRATSANIDEPKHNTW